MSVTKLLQYWQLLPLSQARKWSGNRKEERRD